MGQLEVAKRFLSDAFSRKSETIDALIELSQISSTADPYDKKLKKICESATRLLRCDRSSIFVYQPDGKFVGAFNAGNPPDIERVFYRHRVPLRDPLVAEAFKLKHYVLVKNAAQDQRMNQQTAKTARIRSIVISPLFTLEGQPLAFITAEFNESKGAFSHRESQLLDGIARLVELTLRTQTLAAEKDALAKHAIRSERLDSIRQLSAGLAHDLNNRLTVILGTLDLLPEDVPEEAVLPIAQAANAAARMSQQLLQFSRGDLSEGGQCNVYEMLANTESELRRSVSSKATLTVTNEADIVLPLSSTQLYQIVINLVMNAFDAIEDKGEIRVRSDMDETGHWFFEVSDTGVGISEQIADKVFEPFVTTKDLGSGLGLSGVQGIVNMVGGEICHRANEPCGTVFSVRVPVPSTPQPAELTQREADNANARPLRIAVVDDDESIRSIVQTFVEQEGHQCVLSTTGSDPRLDQITDIDLVISDIVMPDRDGLELCAQLFERIPNLKVMFVSGYYPTITQEQSVPPGSVFLAKPFSLEELKHKIHSLTGARAS